MNTNNKEVIELLEQALKFGHINNVFSAVQAAIRILQDNEDTEVQEEPSLKELDEELRWRVNTADDYVRLTQNGNEVEMSQSKFSEISQFVYPPKPSSKVEKLKELQRRFSTNLDYGAQWADLVKILNVLIEDEE